MTYIQPEPVISLIFYLYPITYFFPCATMEKNIVVQSKYFMVEHTLTISTAPACFICIIIVSNILISLKTNLTTFYKNASFEDI